MIATLLMEDTDLEIAKWWKGIPVPSTYVISKAFSFSCVKKQNALSISLWKFSSYHYTWELREFKN